jgi:microcystin-dependent protein
MALYTEQNLPADGKTPIEAADVNVDIRGLIDTINALDNANIAAGANIDGDKLADGSVSVSKIETPGVMMLYAGATAPSGWLLCQGQAISRTTYATLFAVIGTTYGVGDGSSTFNLPDLQDRVPVGKSGTKALGSTGGAATVDLSHTHTGPSHTHTGPSHTHAGPSHTHGYTSKICFGNTQVSSCPANFHALGGDTGETIYTGAGGTGATGAGGTGATGASGTGVTGSGGSATQSVLDPYQALNYIIRY